ncbi:TolC family outer membrane protein [Chromobacterium amazonense]|uniref:TolC family outer membrane protein n=1 Tax=Chromobacterium amazonense TaxID=1382803 RepID=UPI0031F64CC3
MKNIIRYFLIATFMVCLPGTSRAFGLVEAWDAARNFNPEYAAAQHQLYAEREKKNIGRAGLLPQISIATNHTRNHWESPVSMPSSEVRSYSFQLNQPLFDVGKYAAFQRGGIEAKMADVQFDLSRQQLLASVIRAYLEASRAQDLLAATLAAKKAYQLQVKQAYLAQRLGTASLLELNEAQAALDGASAKELEDRNELERWQLEVERLTGLDGRMVRTVDNLLALKPHPESEFEYHANRAMIFNHSIRLAEFAVEASKSEVLAKKGLHTPVLALSAAYSDRHDVDGFPVRKRGSSVGVTFSMPIFSGGSHQAQLRESLASRDAAQEKLEATRRQVKVQMRKALNEMNGGWELKMAKEKLLLSSKSKLDSTKIGLKVGLRSQLDLLQAEQAYLDAFAGLIESKHRYLISHVNFALLMGDLERDMLSRLNDALGMSARLS